MWFISGLSVHIIELVKLENIIALVKEFTSCYVRSMSGFNKEEYQSQLSTETWEDVFEWSDTNVIFNSFLDIYLKFFNANFTKSKLHSTHG